MLKDGDTLVSQGHPLLVNPLEETNTRLLCVFRERTLWLRDHTLDAK